MIHVQFASFIRYIIIMMCDWCDKNILYKTSFLAVLDEMVQCLGVTFSTRSEQSQKRIRV